MQFLNATWGEAKVNFYPRFGPPLFLALAWLMKIKRSHGYLSASSLSILLLLQSIGLCTMPPPSRDPIIIYGVIHTYREREREHEGNGLIDMLRQVCPWHQLTNEMYSYGWLLVSPLNALKEGKLGVARGSSGLYLWSIDSCVFAVVKVTWVMGLLFYWAHTPSKVKVLFSF